ncbi:MAG TPA: tetratricopeptide repeat protein [Vicinamibacterales bacterium]|jgi:tol-pal system protein YbgF|nr:tetratricopeptide repeat protein [Vicinamibacterales bacterium]
MKHWISPLVIAVAIALGFTVHLSAADKETRQMMADIRMLQEQTQQLQNAISMLSKAMSDALDVAVRNVNTRMDSKLEEQTNATRKALADQKLSLDAITRDVTVLREKVDENNVRVGQLTQEVTALRQLVTQLGISRSGFDPALGPADTVPALASTAPTGGGANLGMSPTAAWDQAYSDFTGAQTPAQYDMAIQGFEAYIKSFPASPNAAEAQLNICMSYLQMPNYAKAVDACDVVIRSYPTSSRVPDAYYKKGVALRSLNRNEDARTAFEAVEKNFPNSDAATLAKTQLMSLQTPAAPPATRRP